MKCYTFAAGNNILYFKPMANNTRIGNKAVTAIQNYIDELLLGPVSEHCTPVFEKGTKVLSCFKKDNVLYINLSDDVLKADSQTTDFRKQIDLFEKNVFRNFGSINKIELFIDGKTAFDAD